MVLRPIECRDLEAVGAMVRAYYREDGLPTWRTGRQDAALAALVDGEPLAASWVVEAVGEALGYAILTVSFSLESGGRDGFIDELYLRPAWRRRGIGERVLDALVGEARARGLKRLYLEVEHRNPAVRLYHRAGFVAHHRTLMSRFV